MGAPARTILSATRSIQVDLAGSLVDDPHAAPAQFRKDIEARDDRTPGLVPGLAAGPFPPVPDFSVAGGVGPTAPEEGSPSRPSLILDSEANSPRSGSGLPAVVCRPGSSQPGDLHRSRFGLPMSAPSSRSPYHRYADGSFDTWIGFIRESRIAPSQSRALSQIDPGRASPGSNLDWSFRGTRDGPEQISIAGIFRLPCSISGSR